MAYDLRISDWSSDVCSSDLGAILVDFQNLGPGPQIDPQLPGRFAENVGEIRIEIAERLLHHFQNGHLARASTLGDVREFHRNESTADEHRPVLPFGQLEEICAGRQQFIAGDIKRHRTGPRGQMKVSSQNSLTIPPYQFETNKTPPSFHTRHT